MFYILGYKITITIPVNVNAKVSSNLAHVQSSLTSKLTESVT